MKKFYFVIILIINSPAIAGITFTSGKWESTFDCSEWAQGSSLTCDSLSKAGDWTCSAQNKDQITSDANFLGGKDGKGFRHWKGDGVAVNGGGISVGFPVPQKELWIRWYMRYESGFTWENIITDKLLYIYTGATSIDAIPIFYGFNEIALISQGTPNYYQVRTGSFGWKQINSGSTGDGNFHSFEVYIKMDTNGSNGAGRLWVDGVLRAENTNVNWSNNNATAQLGWTWFLIGSNQKTPSNGRCAYVDYDDIAVFNSKPPSFDFSGNPYIGQLKTAPYSLIVK